MKNESVASDVDVYTASMPGKSGVAIAAIAFNNSSCAQPFADALSLALDRLVQSHGAFELIADASGAFISFVTPWPSKVVDRLLGTLAGELDLSVSIDRVSRSVAEKLHMNRR